MIKSEPAPKPTVLGDLMVVATLVAITGLCLFLKQGGQVGFWTWLTHQPIFALELAYRTVFFAPIFIVAGGAVFMMVGNNRWPLRLLVRAVGGTTVLYYSVLFREFGAWMATWH